MWVKNSSPSFYAVGLAIIFTISRHESPTRLLKGRMFLTDWIVFRVSGVMPLVLESEARGKCVRVEDLSSSRLINIPSSNHSPMFLHQWWWSVCVCVCACLGSSVWLDITQRCTPIIRVRHARSGRACVSSVSISLIATASDKHNRTKWMRGASALGSTVPQ